MKLNTDFNTRAFNISEAAEYAHVSRGTIESWLRNGLIPYEELPNGGKGIHRFRRIRKADLDAFLNECYHVTNHPEKQKYSQEIVESEVFLLPK